MSSKQSLNFNVQENISEVRQLSPSIGGKTRLQTSCNGFTTLHRVWSQQQRNHVKRENLCVSTSLVEQLACRHVSQITLMHTDTASYVKSCMQKRMRKLKSRVVTYRYSYINRKLGDRHGVIC